jgi:hypothetical protein
MSYAKRALVATCSRRKLLSDKELFGEGAELHPFQKTLGQTFILFLVNFVVSLGVSGAIGRILSSLLTI